MSKVKNPVREITKILNLDPFVLVLGKEAEGKAELLGFRDYSHLTPAKLKAKFGLPETYSIPMYGSDPVSKYVFKNRNTSKYLVLVEICLILLEPGENAICVTEEQFFKSQYPQEFAVKGSSHGEIVNFITFLERLEGRK